MEEDRNKGGRPKGSKNVKSEIFKQKSKDLILESLRNNLGIVTPSLRAAGVRREMFYTYYKEDEVFRKEVDNIREEALDFAESQLLKQIKEGGAAQTIFYLKTKGKSRGYVETTEQHMTIDTVKIRYIVPDVSNQLESNNQNTINMDNNFINLELPDKSSF